MKAKSKFAKYKVNGVVIKGDYSDNTWILSDQLHTCLFTFTTDKKLYQKYTASWAGCSADCFIECIKAYVTFQLGLYSIEFLRQISKQLLSLCQKTEDEIISDDFGSFKIHVTGFLEMLPSTNPLKDQMIEELADYDWTHKRKSNARNLADFKYYLRFDSILKKFWKDAFPDERLFYFPVWFWWNLTAILPLRVTEFLMTPRECLCCRNGRFYLTVRRTRKKKQKREVFYRVEKDYETVKYEIPEWLYSEVENYIHNTSHREIPFLKTLLIPKYEKTELGYFSYNQLKTRLQMFCEQIIGDEGFPINLGDTRHLAMINLVLSGGSPVICKELADHEDINISSNYYANISKVVESSVYELCHGYANPSMICANEKYYVSLPKEKIHVQNGWCDYIQVEKGDISECIKNYHDGTYLGDCSICSHYYPEDQGVSVKMMQNYKKTVDMDGAYLLQMINLVRKGMGYPEDIEQALLKLQSSAHHYGKLLVKQEREEAIWQDQEKLPTKN